MSEPTPPVPPDATLPDPADQPPDVAPIVEVDHS